MKKKLLRLLVVFSMMFVVGCGKSTSLEGKVVDGKEVVDRIGKVKTGSQAGYQDVPLEDVVIESAEIC